MAIDYSKSVQLRIAARKTEYRKGDNLIISYAIRSIAEFPLFILEDPDPKIAISGNDGKLKEIMHLIIDESVLIPQQFKIFKKHEYFLGEMDLLVGCEGFRDHNAVKVSSDNKTFFEKNLFSNWGRNGCIDIDKEQTISIAFTTKIPHVMKNKNRREKQYPTAIGETKSNVLELKIIN